MKNTRILFITLLALLGVASTLQGISKIDQVQAAKANIAVLANTSGSSRGGGPVAELNDGLTPNSVPDGMRHRRPQRLTAQWFQYDCVNPVPSAELAIFWYIFDNIAKLPTAY